LVDNLISFGAQINHASNYLLNVFLKETSNYLLNVFLKEMIE